MQKRTWPISSHQDGFFRRVKHNLKASKERQTHGTPRLLCDCLHSPKKHEKITPNKLRFPSRIMSELQDYSAALPTSGDLKSGDSLFRTTPPPPPRISTAPTPKEFKSPFYLGDLVIHTGDTVPG